MGKHSLGAGAQSASALAVEQENGGEVTPCACCSVSGVCLRSTLKWIVAVVLGVSLLLFGIFSFPIFGKGYSSGKQGSSAQVQIAASFRLQRPVSSVQANVSNLESDILDEIGVRNTKVTIISLVPLASNWTEVVFGVFPYPKNASISSADLSVLKSSLNTLVLQQSELNLTPDLFGKVYYFQLLKFPGGITVVPKQSGFPLQQMVLFNFTLNYSIVQVDQNLDELKDQLKRGLHLRSSENLFVQLTNSNGSTVDPPIIVQITVMSYVGTGLPSPRLKQLAEDISASHAGNLGLNHTTFGNVKQIRLSSYLQYSLTPPSPSSSPAPPPSYYSPPHSHHHHHHHHHHHNHSHHHHHHHHHNHSHHHHHPHHHHHHHHHHHIAPSSQHYNLAPYRLVGPMPLHDHHHLRHAPDSRLGGSPSPSYSNSPHVVHGIHHHKVVSAPHAESPLPSLSPQSGPCPKAQPCYSHLPRLFLMSAPASSLGGRLTSLPLFPADTPTPSASGSSFSLPRSVLVSRINIPSPENSRHSDADPSNGELPVPAFSSISASSFGVKPSIQVVFALVHSMGMLLIFLYP